MPTMRPTAAGDSAPRPSARTACGSNASGAIDKGSRAADQRVLPRPPHAAKPDLAEVEPQRAGERPRVAAPVAVHDERSPRRDQRNHGEELRQRDLRLVGVRDVVHHVVELPSGLCEPGDGGLGVRADDLQLADTIEPEPLAGNTHDERIALDHGDVPWGGETVEQVDLRAAAQADEQRGRSPGELDGVERLPPVFTAHRSPVAVERIDREDFTMNHEPALCAAVDHADPARQARPSSEDDARPLQLGAVTNAVPVTGSDLHHGRFAPAGVPAPGRPAARTTVIGSPRTAGPSRPTTSCGSHYRGCIRIAPSSRIVSPFSIAFSMMCRASAANSAGRPRRDGKGTCLPSDVRTGSGRVARSGVSKMPGAIVTTRIPSSARSRATGSVMPTMPPFEAE